MSIKTVAAVENFLISRGVEYEGFGIRTVGRIGRVLSESIIDMLLGLPMFSPSFTTSISPPPDPHSVTRLAGCDQ